MGDRNKPTLVRGAFTLCASLCFLAPLPAGAAEDLPPGFGWFAALAGACWVGQFPDGHTEHTQCYTTQFGKLLRGTASLASVKDGTRQLLFEGDSVFAWDEAGRRITYSIWGSDGAHRHLQAHYVGDELHFPVPSRADAAQIAYRSVWRRIDAATFEVRRERPQADRWTTELSVTYRKRSADAGPPR